jgi:hypothetical protein
MNEPKFNSVDEALASVRREVSPTRDLWSGIAQELGERTDKVAGTPTDLTTVRAARSARAVRVPWPLALAASLAVVSLVGALGWSVMHQRGAPELNARNMLPAIADNALVRFGPPQNAAYVAAHADLERTFNERIKLLAPATRLRVQADLETIRRANDDLRAALAKDPASPLLLQLLHSTGQQEIDLYTSVAQSTEPLLTRRTQT